MILSIEWETAYGRARVCEADRVGFDVLTL